MKVPVFLLPNPRVIQHLDASLSIGLHRVVVSLITELLRTSLLLVSSFPWKARQVASLTLLTVVLGLKLALLDRYGNLRTRWLELQLIHSLQLAMPRLIR